VNIARVQRALLHSQMAVIDLSNQVRRLETEAVHWRERAVLLEAKLAEHQQEQEKAA
jgi:predicted  nucleic acid-binding Zn-ribbon protein